MKGKKQSEKPATVYERIRQILESARASVPRSVNTAQVMANWLIGREIVEEEQSGKRRAGYGEKLLKELSEKLTADVGKGWSIRNLEYCRNFYLKFPLLLDSQNSNALRSNFSALAIADESFPQTPAPAAIGHSVSDPWQPGQLHPNLSWTHYRILLGVDKEDARAFYEIEAIKNNWSARELERQKNSLLFERLTLSRDKKGVMQTGERTRQDLQRQDVEVPPHPA
jgi:hypothetical protein